MRRAAASIVAAAMLLAGSTTAAHAAPRETVVQGSVLRLVSIEDTAALADARPGVPVAWDVGVSASRPDGTIDVALEASATPDAFLVAVRSCAERWQGAACPGGAEPLLDAALVDGSSTALARQPSSASAWYRVEVVLQAAAGRASADLRLVAEGMGDDLGVGGDPPGPDSHGAGIGAVGAGGTTPGTVAPTSVGVLAVVAGLAVALLATGARLVARSRARITS